MSQLKEQNLNKCFSMLREFIEGTPQDNQKGMAILALKQLERITAGTTENPESQCIETPLADGIPMGMESFTQCIETPLADGTPPPGTP
jgi:hypothetical protein